MEPIHAAALRETAAATAQRIHDLEAQAAELQALKALRQAELDTLTPAQLDRQITLEGEIMAADKLLGRNAATIEAARAELAGIEAQAGKADQLERMAAVSQEMDSESRAIGAEMQAIYDLLDKHMAKIIDPERVERLAGLRTEWHTLAREYNGANLGTFGPMGEDADKQAAILEQVEALGGHAGRLKAMSTFTALPLPSLHETPRHTLVTALWRDWQDAAKPKDPSAGFVPSLPASSEMVVRMMGEALPSVPSFVQPYEAPDRMPLKVRMNEPLSALPDQTPREAAMLATVRNAANKQG